MQWLRVFIKFFNSINIRTKFLVPFFFAVLVPVIILGIYFINRMSKITTSYTVNNFHMEVDRLERNVAGIMKTAKDLSDRFYIDKELQSILIRNFSSLLEMTETIKSYTEFDYYTQIHEEVAAVRIYTTNQTIQENWRFMEVTDGIAGSGWYREVQHAKGMTSWFLFFDAFRDEYKLRLARSMPVYEGGIINVLTVDVHIQAVAALLNEEAFATLLFLGDPGTTGSEFITTGSREAELFVETGQLSLSEWNTGAGGNGFITINDFEYYRVSRQMGTAEYLAPFYLVSLFPVSRLKEIRENMVFLGLVLILICLAASTGLILVFSHYSLIKRIRFLSTGMRKIVAGNLGISLKLEGQDEIGILSRDIDTMIGNLKVLIGKVYEADLQKQQYELKQKHMQFKLLASQVNPHFFFNALETIRAKALSHRIDELNKIVKALGKIMRISLENQHNPVTIASEIEFVLHYLGIQKYRFEEKLIYDIYLKENMKHWKVIPYILQPVVENAIVHGVERKINPCRINIKVHKEDSHLILSVEDDGVGIEEEKLKHIRQSLQSNLKTPNGILGIGLMNVHQRIRLYYGDPYGINIDSKTNVGTKVKLILPFIGDE